VGSFWKPLDAQMAFAFLAKPIIHNVKHAKRP
jgi:hypothetical protein